jgi:O-antigen ligase
MKYMSKFYTRVIDYIWLALVALLPITSLPLVAKIVGSSSVAPASLIFLGLLILLWFPVYLKKDGRFPFQTKIIFVFLLIALISTALSFLYLVPMYKSNTLIRAVFEGVATFVIGFFFYLVTTAVPNTDKKLSTTLKVLNWSGLVMVIWALFYFVVTIVSNDATRDVLQTIQFQFTTSRLYDNRAMGFASEPSWLANLLNLLYLPYWLAATLTRFTAHKKKFWKFSLENLLLALGIVSLYATLSRAGYFAFFLVLGFLFIKLNVYMVKRISQRWSSNRMRTLLNVLLVAAIVLTYLAIVFGTLYVFSKVDPRMADVFSVQFLKERGFAKYLDKLQFGERITYWQTGWRIFNAHPLFGVGLGNAGFYFKQLLPDYAWQLSEVRVYSYHSGGLLNVKSMWMRIFAELGIVGFSVFFVFLLVTAFTSSQLLRSSSQFKRTIGWMGIFMLIAFIVEGFSVDSFALPYMWFTTGFVAAAWRWTNSL